jgi:predicted SAM-dependent methyltransferase
MMTTKTRINIGCGMTPTEGWLNLDNSPSLRLAKFPFMAEVLHRAGLLDKNQFDYAGYCRSNRIKFADGTRRIPVPDGGAEVVYASHVIDLLDRTEIRLFLAEARRALRPGGTLRIVVPDLGKLLAEYQRNQDADRFMSNLMVCAPRARTLAQRIRLLMVGDRMHKWAYDGKSLAKLLVECGFEDPVSLPPGETRIPDPGPLNLRERSEHHPLYMEARRP